MSHRLIKSFKKYLNPFLLRLFYLSFFFLYLYFLVVIISGPKRLIIEAKSLVKGNSYQLPRTT